MWEIWVETDGVVRWCLMRLPMSVWTNPKWSAEFCTWGRRVYNMYLTKFPFLLAGIVRKDEMSWKYTRTRTNISQPNFLPSLTPTYTIMNTNFQFNLYIKYLLYSFLGLFFFGVSRVEKKLLKYLMLNWEMRFRVSMNTFLRPARDDSSGSESEKES